MKNSLILFVLIFAFSFSALSQNSDPRHKNFFKTSDVISGKDYRVLFKNVVAKMDYAKLAVEIHNNSYDFMMFIQNEPKFVFDFGEFSSKDKSVYIFPNNTKKETLKVFGGYQFHVDAFKLIMDGLYIIPTQVEADVVEDFKLPASVNYLDTEHFKIHLLKASQKTSESYAKFQVEYTGDKIAIVNPSKISVGVDGTDLIYANDDKKDKPILLKRGEKATIKAVFHIPGRIADMQFSTLYIKWGDCFKESEPQKLDAVSIEFILDEDLTRAKNK